VVPNSRREPLATPTPMELKGLTVWDVEA
jgi:hypothetical protein